MNQLVRVAAYELAPLGVRVNALSPGITATPLALEENPEIFAERTKTVPMGRAGTPEDMAAAALFLASRGCELRHRGQRGRRWRGVALVTREEPVDEVPHEK